jgi:hypothetical protein
MKTKKRMGRPPKSSYPKTKKSPPRRGHLYPKKAEAKRRDWAEASPEKRAEWAVALKEATQRRVESQNPTNWRTGIPNGMRREEAEAEWRFAGMYAKEVVKIMVDEKLVPDDPKVTKAFEAAVQVLESPMTQTVKLQAARLILDFLKAKPVAKSEITVQKAEDWLAQVTADHIARTEGNGQ